MDPPIKLDNRVQSSAGLYAAVSRSLLSQKVGNVARIRTFCREDSSLPHKSVVVGRVAYDAEYDDSPIMPPGYLRRRHVEGTTRITSNIPLNFGVWYIVAQNAVLGEMRPDRNALRTTRKLLPQLNNVMRENCTPV